MLDIYATSVDYTPDAELSQQFFATVQNKMHWAAHGHTAAEVIHERADAKKPSWACRPRAPAASSARTTSTVAKNYLTEHELQVLNRIVNLYIEYAELQALERKPMTMRDWVTKLDEFLKISGRELLDHAGTISAETPRQRPSTNMTATRRSGRETAHDRHGVRGKVKQLKKPAQTRGRRGRGK